MFLMQLMMISLVALLIKLARGYFNIISITLIVISEWEIRL
jgi:hypothetical protein